MYFYFMQYYRDMSLVNQDNMSKVVGVTGQLIYEKWTKLTDNCRTQVNQKCFQYFNI